MLKTRFVSPCCLPRLPKKMSRPTWNSIIYIDDCRSYTLERCIRSHIPYPAEISRGTCRNIALRTLPLPFPSTFARFLCPPTRFHTVDSLPPSNGPTMPTPSMPATMATSCSAHPTLPTDSIEKTRQERTLNCSLPLPKKSMFSPRCPCSTAAPP